MQFSEAIAKVRSATLHDDDEQFTANQLRDDCLIEEYRRLRTWLCTFVPSLCEAVVSGIVVSGGLGVIPKSALPNFERLRRLERFDGSNYWPLDLSLREQPTQFQLAPPEIADGTYRAVYLVGAPDDIDDNTMIDLPPVLRRVLVERGCCWVCNRHSGDRDRLPYHTKREIELMEEAHVTLVQRYGDHGESALRRESLVR